MPHHSYRMHTSKDGTCWYIKTSNLNLVISHSILCILLQYIDEKKKINDKWIPFLVLLVHSYTFTDKTFTMRHARSAKLVCNTTTFCTYLGPLIFFTFLIYKYTYTCNILGCIRVTIICKKELTWYKAINCHHDISAIPASRLAV